MTIKLPFGLRLAREAFRKSKHLKRPVGSALLDSSKIRIGCNKLKTSPLSQELGAPWDRVHAEVSVLKGFNGGGGILYVYREKKDGSLGMARPCSSCMKLISKLKIKKVIYTTDTGFASERLI